MRQALDGFFTNQLGAAEKLCEERMRMPPPPSEAGALRDTRGVFALMHALFALLNGLASLVGKQLPEALPRLQHADSLLSLDSPWLGQKMARGLCALLTGICLVAKHRRARDAPRPRSRHAPAPAT